MELIFYILLLVLFFLAYYYFVKIKEVRSGSLVYLLITTLSIISTLRISYYIVELLGGKNDDLTWWDVPGIGLGIFFHLLVLGVAENFIGKPAKNQ